MTRLAVLSLLLALTSPVLASPIRYITYEEKTLGRLQTLCDDGTRAVSTWSPTLQGWRAGIMSEEKRRSAMDEQQRDEQLLASAIQFLLDGGDEKAATILISCTLRYDEEEYRGNSYTYTTRTITLAAPRLSYDFLYLINSDYYKQEEPNVPAELAEKVDICGSIRMAFQALTDADVQFVVKASLVPITAQWREELLALLRGDRLTNQGLPFAPQRPVLTWNSLRFRSGGEVRIAEALERAQVLFLPNCMARLGFSHRENREADFLICQKGKWGILEVDHPFTHPASRKVDDDERARLFKAHGIRLVEHFDAGNCLEDADGIVRRFLYLWGQ